MSFQPYRFIVASMACLISMLTVATAHGQDGLSLEEVQKQWTELNKTLDEKQALLESGDTTPGLSAEFGNLVAEANDLINQIRTAAIAKLDADPESNETVRLLLGVMINDAKSEKDGEVLEAGDALIRAKANYKYFEYGATTDKLELTGKRIFEELMIRHREAQRNDLPQVELETSKGKIVIELFENEAPNTVANFISLVESGYYSNKLFHNVVEGVFAQTGGFEKPGIGPGNPGYKIKCESKSPDARPHFTGSLSMATANGEQDTGGGQFFMTYKRTEDFDGISTVFGRVVSGMDVLEKLEFTSMVINGSPQEIPEVNYDKIVSAKVIRKREHEYNPKKVGDPEPKSTAPTAPDLSKKTEDADAEKEDSDSESKTDEASKNDESEKSDPDKADSEPTEPEKEKDEDGSTEKESDDKDGLPR
jgi:cyclophilin family peptidyl-prolyl cis-trans isomerase